MTIFNNNNNISEDYTYILDTKEIFYEKASIPTGIFIYNNGSWSERRTNNSNFDTTYNNIKNFILVHNQPRLLDIEEDFNSLLPSNSNIITKKFFIRDGTNDGISKYHIILAEIGAVHSIIDVDEAANVDDENSVFVTLNDNYTEESYHMAFTDGCSSITFENILAGQYRLYVKPLHNNYIIYNENITIDNTYPAKIGIHNNETITYEEIQEQSPVYVGTKTETQENFPELPEHQYFAITFDDTHNTISCIPIKSLSFVNTKITDIEDYTPNDEEYLSAKQTFNLIKSEISKIKLFQIIDSLASLNALENPQTNRIYFVQKPADASDGLNFTFDLYSYNPDYTNANDKYIKLDKLEFDIRDVIKKSSTAGLIKNDGTIDTNIYLTQHQDISGKEDKSNKVSSWSATTNNTRYPTEKLVKTSLDGKASTNHNQATSTITEANSLSRLGISANSTQHDINVAINNLIDLGEAEGDLAAVDDYYFDNQDKTLTLEYNEGKLIKNIAKTNTVGLVDYYAITYSDDTIYQFSVTNGQDGNVTIDSSLNSVSENPVQNKVVADALTNGTKNANTIIASNAYANIGSQQNNNLETVLGKVNTALGSKVSVQSGKALSTNDFTNAYKTKLDGIAEGADNVTVSRSLSSGTKIGTITINNTGTDLYTHALTDNLTTNDNTKALSAKQGYALKGLLDDKFNETTSTNNTQYQPVLSDDMCSDKWTGVGQLSQGIDVTNDTIYSAQGDRYLEYSNTKKVRITLTNVTSSSGSTWSATGSGNDGADHPMTKDTPVVVTLAANAVLTLSFVESGQTIEYTVQAITKTINSIADIVYPIGAIYMSLSPTHPSILFGGAWTALENRFLLGASNTYEGGATGGSKDAIVVKHNHTQTGHNHSPTTSGNKFLVSADNIAVNAATERKFPDASSGGHHFVYTDDTNPSGINENTTTTTVTPTINDKGSDGTDKNMPPYLSVYMWKRTA